MKDLRLACVLLQGQEGEKVTPDLVIGPNTKTTWLNKVGQELEEWATCKNDLISHKPMRQAWAEAIKIKRDIEKRLIASAAKIATAQETILHKQDVTVEQIQRLPTIVQELKDHLQKKKERVVETKPLRDGVKHELYQQYLRVGTRAMHTSREPERGLF